MSAVVAALMTVVAVTSATRVGLSSVMAEAVMAVVVVVVMVACSAMSLVDALTASTMPSVRAITYEVTSFINQQRGRVSGNMKRRIAGCGCKTGRVYPCTYTSCYK